MNAAPSVQQRYAMRQMFGGRVHESSRGVIYARSDSGTRVVARLIVDSVIAAGWAERVNDNYQLTDDGRAALAATDGAGMAR